MRLLVLILFLFTVCATAQDSNVEIITPEIVTKRLNEKFRQVVESQSFSKSYFGQNSRNDELFETSMSIINTALELSTNNSVVDQNILIATLKSNFLIQQKDNIKEAGLAIEELHSLNTCEAIQKKPKTKMKDILKIVKPSYSAVAESVSIPLVAQIVDGIYNGHIINFSQSDYKLRTEICIEEARKKFEALESELKACLGTSSSSSDISQNPSAINQ